MMMGLGSKLSSLGDRLNKNGGDTSGTVAGATATAGAVDRMTEIARRESEARRALEAQYEKFRVELAAAYAAREKVDNENFDKISEINYGIISATEEVVGLDKRVLIANLKAKENAEMLMPVPEDKKKVIDADILADIKKELAEITKKYEARTKEAVAAAKRYEEADALVKQKEAEKAKLRNSQAEALKKIQAEQAAEREKLLKEAKDAVEIAKEKQRLEMVGWIVKALLGVGILLLLIGFLMKSPTFIVAGIAMLGLSYVAATIPFWVVATVMGLGVLAMVLLDPKGRPHFAKKKAETPPSAPPPSPPPSTP
jgi:uncharacterized membrane protein